MTTSITHPSIPSETPQVIPVYPRDSTAPCVVPLRQHAKFHGRNTMPCPKCGTGLLHPDPDGGMSCYQCSAWVPIPAPQPAPVRSLRYRKLEGRGKAATA